MNNHELRSIILNLHRRLSDQDRERLHFYLRNDVPRIIGDDLSSTLKLMDSLFDQAIISDQNFTFLIDAFKKIQCLDAVKLLQKHERRMLLSGLNYSSQSLSSMLSAMVDQPIDDEETDSGPTENLLVNQINYLGKNNNTNNVIDGTNISVNPIRSDLDSELISSPPLRQSQLFCTPSLNMKYLLFLSLLFILISGVLIVFLVLKTIDNQKLKEDCRNEKNLFLYKQNQSDHLLKERDNDLSEKDKTIDQLHREIVDLEIDRSTVLIKAGRKFGGTDGDYFDDSSPSSFTTSHYLSGLIISADAKELNECQFIYTSSLDNQSRIESNIHGNFGRKIQSPVAFTLHPNETIYKVYVQMVVMTFQDNQSSRTRKIVRGLKFFTTRGRSIPPDTHLTGDVSTEQFDGYTLGYVTGRCSGSIDQLQFFWYRTL